MYNASPTNFWSIASIKCQMIYVERTEALGKPLVTSGSLALLNLFVFIRVNSTFTCAVSAGGRETDGSGDSGACFINETHCPVIALEEKWLHNT